MVEVESEVDEEHLKYLTYCGHYCGLCSERKRIPQRAKLLQEAMKDEGWDRRYKEEESIRERFPVFWEFLGDIINQDCACRTGGGPPDCKIRICAEEKRVVACIFCDDYPCEYIEFLAEHYPMKIHDGKRLKKIGLKAWVKEQEERARRGFVYTDVRIPWDEWPLAD